MASSKSYDLYLGLGIFVILLSQVCADVLPKSDATNLGESLSSRKVILDGRIGVEDFMKGENIVDGRKGDMIPGETPHALHNFYSLS